MKLPLIPSLFFLIIGGGLIIVSFIACEKNHIGPSEYSVEKDNRLALANPGPDRELRVSAGCDHSNRPEIQAQLIQVGTLSEAKTGMAVASAGSKIFFAGASLKAVPGQDYPEYGSDLVEIFDATTQSMTTRKLSSSRSNVTAVHAGTKIFFAGGRLGDGANDELFSNVDIYDVATDTWESSNLSEPRYNIGSASSGNKVFFAGGVKDWDYNTSGRVDIYDLTSKSWSSAELSKPRTNISAIAANNKIYFSGGHEEDRWYSSPSRGIDVYDLASQRWTVSSLLAPLGFLTGLHVGDKIYWSEDCYFQVWDVKTSQSYEMNLTQPSAWNASTGQNMVLKDGKIVLLKLGSSSNNFDIYDINSKSWFIGVLTQPIPSGASVISVNNTIYLAGGSNDGSATALSNKVWKLEFRNSIPSKQYSSNKVNSGWKKAPFYY